MKFVIYEDKKGEFRWRLVARNSKTVADSAEGYKTKRGVRRAVVNIITEIRIASTIVFSDEVEIIEQGG